MITELRITDLGVINDATISLHQGLTVVTGETGAGKTMIVTGLGLLLGGRADPRSVRRGSERARVEGRFKIENAELLQQVSESGGELDEGELIVARHVTAVGRSRAYLGGAQVPASVCAELTTRLVKIHGQAEQERLTEADRQRQLLDRFAGAAVLEPLARYSAFWSEDRAARTELADLSADLARYLDGLDSQPGRLEQIAERRAQLSKLTRKYGSTCDEVLQWATDSAVRLTQLGQSDERIAVLTERLEQLRTELTA